MIHGCRISELGVYKGLRFRLLVILLVPWDWA